jgi:hypothetical protein
MRAVWSFWSKPYFSCKGRIWLAPVHHLLAWGLSYRLAQRHYPETVLVTDKAGEALLVHSLGLDFTHVSTELESLHGAAEGWWALGKLVAYGLQDQPFVHLDTDVFLWKPLPDTLANADVFAQCPEDHSRDEWSTPRKIEETFAQYQLALPVEWQWMSSQSRSGFREENCGIMGGNRVDFIRHYAHLALDTALNRAHAPAWRAADLLNNSGFNNRIEQFLLAACVDYHRSCPNSPYRGVRIKYLFPSWDKAFDPAATARAGFTHLMNDAKLFPAVMLRLEQRVQLEDRAFYRHCMRLTGASPLAVSAG